MSVVLSTMLCVLAHVWLGGLCYRSTVKCQTLTPFGTGDKSIYPDPNPSEPPGIYIYAESISTCTVLVPSYHTWISTRIHCIPVGSHDPFGRIPRRVTRATARVSARTVSLLANSSGESRADSCVQPGAGGGGGVVGIHQYL